MEGDRADAAPIPEGAPLAERRAVRLPVIGNVDVERECAFRPDVAAVVDLRHDLVAVVQSRALDSELVRRHRETHEGRRACGLALRLSELRNLVELAYARLLGAASPADRHKCAAGRPRWHSGEGNEAAPSIRALFIPSIADCGFRGVSRSRPPRAPWPNCESPWRPGRSNEDRPLPFLCPPLSRPS